MWRRSLAEDLEIAAQRSQSKRAAQAASNMQRAAINWNEVRLRLIAGIEPDVNWATLDHYTAIVEQQIDLLVNYTAGDAFLYRQTASSTVSREMYLNSGLHRARAADLLRRGVAAGAAHHRAGGRRLAVAGQIAGGKLNVEIPEGSADELGKLLAAHAADARQHQGDDAARGGSATLCADAAGRRAGKLARRRGAGRQHRPPGAGQFAGRQLPGHLDPIAAAGHADVATRPADREGDAAQLPPTGEALLEDGRWLRVSHSETRDGGSIVVCSDISLLKRQEETLKGTNLRLDAALDNMSQGLCLFDKDNRLQVVNRRFCEIFGLPRDSLQPGMTYRHILDASVAAGNHPGKTAVELVEDQRPFIGAQTPARISSS